MKASVLVLVIEIHALEFVFRHQGELRGVRLLIKGSCFFHYFRLMVVLNMHQFLLKIKEQFLSRMHVQRNGFWRDW